MITLLKNFLKILKMTLYLIKPASPLHSAGYPGLVNYFAPFILKSRYPRPCTNLTRQIRSDLRTYLFKLLYYTYVKVVIGKRNAFKESRTHSVCIVSCPMFVSQFDCPDMCQNISIFFITHMKYILQKNTCSYLDLKLWENDKFFRSNGTSESVTFYSDQ